MPTQRQEEPPAAREGPGREQRNAAIGGHVMDALGRPVHLHCVQVRPLWDGHYRVNVFVGADAASATVAHSYFLSADGDGNLIEATPKILRLY